MKTVVTGELGADIARSFNVQVVETLTGFKYIGEKISQWADDINHDFVMGYEESYGYLVGTHAQDKDAVVIVLPSDMETVVLLKSLQEMSLSLSSSLPERVM